jgi:hypothetical protein
MHKGGATGLESAVSGDLELTDGLDDSSRVLRNDLGFASQHRTSRRFGVDAIRLALAMAGVRVRAVDVDDGDASSGQDTGQPCAI